MSEWKIVGSHESMGSAIANALSLGWASSIYTYTVENVSTGQRKIIVARDEHELGERIADGDWEADVDDD